MFIVPLVCVCASYVNYCTVLSSASPSHRPPLSTTILSVPFSLLVIQFFSPTFLLVLSTSLTALLHVIFSSFSFYYSSLRTIFSARIPILLAPSFLLLFLSPSLSAVTYQNKQLQSSVSPLLDGVHYLYRHTNKLYRQCYPCFTGSTTGGNLQNWSP